MPAPVGPWMSAHSFVADIRALAILPNLEKSVSSYCPRSLCSFAVGPVSFSQRLRGCKGGGRASAKYKRHKKSLTPFTRSSVQKKKVLTIHALSVPLRGMSCPRKDNPPWIGRKNLFAFRAARNASLCMHTRMLSQNWGGMAPIRYFVV